VVGGIAVPNVGLLLEIAQQLVNCGNSGEKVMSKICTECQFYPRLWWRRLFGFPPVFRKFAKCECVYTLKTFGEKPYCELERTFNPPLVKCGVAGKYFKYWRKSYED
jgi:hypothetical protein